jgi:hypothetical protein
MKKIIVITIILFGLAGSASAFYSDNTLTNIWKARPDLQKVFPGDPANNEKLESWAKKYGWKESPELYNYYPDKAIVDKLIEVKTSDRISQLEAQVESLTVKINSMANSQTIIAQQPTVSGGKWRKCRITGNRVVVCEIDASDWGSYDNGNFYISFYTK